MQVRHRLGRGIELIPDPFADIEPGFERWQGPRDIELSQPDLTARSLKDWLRSSEGAKEFERLYPPARIKPERQPTLAHIPGFPG